MDPIWVYGWSHSLQTVPYLKFSWVLVSSKINARRFVHSLRFHIIIIVIVIVIIIIVIIIIVIIVIIIIIFFPTPTDVTDLTLMESGR